MNGHRRGDFQIVRLVWILLMAWGLIQPALETGQFLRKAAAAAVQEREVSSSTTAVTPQSAPPRYLIVAPDELAASLGGYIAAKQAQGLDVTLQTLSQTGPTRENIRTAIRNFSPDYLLLVGDVDLLPAWESRSGLTTFTDLYYTTLDGPNDYIPNFPYARLPVHSSAELQAVLAKWAAYEALDGSQAWLSRVAFIASGETDDYSTAEQVHNAMIEQYTAEIGFSGSFPNNPQPGGDRLYARTYSATPADISAALNAGRGLAVYFGQGGTLGWNSPYFTTSEVQQLNGPPLPLLVSFASRNALLSAEQTSFAENWLLHPTSGALSVFAAGADTTRSADERLEEELFRALFAQPSNPPRLGSALLEAMEEFSRYYFLNQTFVQQYYEMYALWGDPTLRLWPDAPQRFSLELDPQTVSVCAGAAQTLAMQVTLKSAQTPAVTLSLPNPPPGVSGTFSANPVHSPGSAVLTLHLSSDLAPGEHTLTVRGESDFIRQDAALPLTVHPAAPEQTPLPLLPANGASGVPLRPQLSWSAVGGAAGYEVQIALDSSFEQIVTAAGNTPQTAYTLTEDLQPGQTYYWRVRALNGCGAGEFSPPARFTTRPPAGECPPHSRAEVLYSQTFDTPADDWQMQNGWQTGSAFGRGGVVSAAAPAEILLQSLTSPLLSLPAEADVLAVHLRAETAYHFGEAGACLDGALLQISNDDGEHWTAVSDEALLTPPYEGALATSFGNPLGGERAWCGQRD
ncbi:MAG: C25 family cysteine peptidase [Chloroflexota bacterium]